MDTISRLAGLMPPEVSERIWALADALCEVRVRAGRPVELRCVDSSGEWVGRSVSGESLNRWLSALMDYSLYAREREIAEGFFTLSDGCRVGVCGRAVVKGGRISDYSAIGSFCVRIARSVEGCSDALMPLLTRREPLASLLIASPPGLGKTTLLRDTARALSEAGHRVGMADERHELAACCQGVPTMNVGPRTDVIDGAPKALAIRQLVRGMSPTVIVTDEIGGADDADALREARRCGAAVVATAHAESFDALLLRHATHDLLASGIFNVVALLGPRPGRIAGVFVLEASREGEAIWKRA